MAIALTVKKVYCPNCKYEGKAKILGTSFGEGMLLLIMFFISFVFPFLWLVTGILFVGLLFKPAKQVCPRCRYEHVVPLKHAKREG